MATLGKIVAGGMPGAALVGRRDILAGLDFRRAAQDGAEKIFHMGTFNAVPTTCAAGIAALDIVRDTEVCQQAIDYGNALMDGLNESFAAEGVSWIAYGSFGGFHVFLNPQGIDTSRERIEAGEHDYQTIKAPNDPALAMKVRLGVLLHGVDIQGWPGVARERVSEIPLEQPEHPERMAHSKYMECVMWSEHCMHLAHSKHSKHTMHYKHPKHFAHFAQFEHFKCSWWGGGVYASWAQAPWPGPRRRGQQAYSIRYAVYGILCTVHSAFSSIYYICTVYTTFRNAAIP